MHKSLILKCFGAAATLCCALLLSACWGASTPTVPSQEFAPYVSSYTSGLVSGQSTIRVQLTQNVASFSSSQELNDNPFSFSPRVKGKAYMAAANVVEFVPEAGELESGKTYNVKFALDQFCNVPEKLSDFCFGFGVRKFDFRMVVEPYTISESSPDMAVVNGQLIFSDKVSAADAEQMLSVNDVKGSYAIEVQHTDNECVVSFRVSNLKVQATGYTMHITANGGKIGIDRKETAEVQIAGNNEFIVVGARHISSPSTGAELFFSKPIKKTQTLQGMFLVSCANKPSVQIEGNKATILFDTKLSGEPYRVQASEGLKASDDSKLSKTCVKQLELPNIKPAVKFNQTAAILPDSKNLIIPFSAVNLYAVDVKVIQFYQSNILQFFQEHNLASSPYSMRYIGKPVAKKTIYLSQNPMVDVHKWNNFSLNLSALFEREPGAIYRIGLSFRKDYSAYPGVNDNKVLDFDEKVITAEELESYSFDMDPYDWNVYDWQQSENPLHATYYMQSSRAAECNVIASNVGVIAKRFGEQQVFVAASNILDATPASGVDITAYSFQQQPIASVSTNGDGFAMLDGCKDAYMIVADDGKQKTYLKVENGENLSVSRFDVGGETVRDGLRGFVYGERDVWRPGDTLHLTFMLDDREESLPENHPATLEVFNARGGLHRKIVNSNGVKGVYRFDVPTSADDETGKWSCYVKVGAASFYKSLRIETIKPNRLKIETDIPSLAEVNQDLYVPVFAEWLTGAKAAGLRSKLFITLSAAKTKFDGFDGYIFDNPSRFSTIDFQPFEQRLDGSGRTEYAFHIPPQKGAAGMLNMKLKTEVYEPGGDASYQTETAMFSPYKKYVGVRFNTPKSGYIETDQNHTFDVVTVDSHGKAVNCDNLYYFIYKRNWNWWYDDSNNTASYFSGTNEKPIASGKISTNGGKGQFTFRVNYPDWGRYVVVVKDTEGGHACGGEVTIDWPNYRGRANRNDPEGAQMLSFSLDKDKYEVGEKATVIIPRTAASGRALVTIESGASILKKEWIKVGTETDTKYTFEVEPKMMPNAYVSITLIQPHNQSANDMPLRMYGIVPILAQDKQTILEPNISMPDQIEPESDFTLEISELNGREMTYTIAIVDEGLLSISNFRTPNPWNSIYTREALGVRTWDMYNDVVGAQAGDFASLFGIGGSDEAAGSSKNAEAQRFNPVVKVLGPFTVGKGKKAKHTVRLPMYVGEVRTMVVAKSGGAYGSAQKSTKVSSPLMLLTTLPRVLSVGEEITVPVNIFAMRNDVKNVSVSIKAEGTDASFVADKQNITFTQTGDQMAYFKLNTGTQVGKLSFRVDAKSGNYSAYENLEIEVRNPNPIVTQRQAVALEGKQNATLSYNTEGSTGSPEVTLELTRLVPFDASLRFNDILRSGSYSTDDIISKTIALLYMKDFKELSDSEKQSAENLVKENLAQLYARQNYDGTFCCWQGSTHTYEWIDTYAGVALALAKEKGYEVNAAVVEKWLRNQNDKATKAPVSTAQAFRLYALALSGKADLSAMNRFKAKEQYTLSSRNMMAAAYALAGKKNVANEVMQSNISSERDNTEMYQSQLRNEAIKLNVLVLTGDQQAAIEQALTLSQTLESESYFNTQSTAFALAALARFADGAASAIDCSWKVGGKAQTDIRTSKAISTTLLPATPAKAEVSITNNSDGLLYAALTTRTHLVRDTLAAQQQGMKLEVTYFDDANRPVSPSSFRQGSTFKVQLRATNTTDDYIEMASLVYNLPSGWEVFESETSGNDTFLFRDVRDDSAVTYFSIGAGSTKTFYLQLQATYEGSYTLPAVLCEDVYRPATNARTAATTTRVERY